MARVLSKQWRFMTVSDLDHTMVDHSDATHDKLLRFNRLWLTEFAPDSLLVFSTGRSPFLFHELAAEVPLLTPDILVCSVGTEILINGEADAEWEEYLNQGWDRQRAAGIAAGLPELELQRDSEQRPHKISYKPNVEDPERVVGALRAQLADAGLETNVVFSAGVDLDILPSRASKGKALSFLMQQLEKGPGLPLAGVMVCGDSGNDIELFAVPGVYGCMVANAMPELRQWCEANLHDKLFRATQDGPGGIVEALHHFSFPNPEKADTVHRRQALVGFHTWCEDWSNASCPRDEAACTAQLEVFDSEFEYVSPDGRVMGRQAFADLVASKVYGSQVAKAQAAAAGDGSGEPAGSHSSSSTSRYCMWMDRYGERQLAPGVWLARFKELHQPYAGGRHTAEHREGRWVSAVVRQQEGASAGDSWRITYVQETRLPKHSPSA